MALEVFLQENEDVPSAYRNLKIFCETAPRIMWYEACFRQTLVALCNNVMGSDPHKGMMLNIMDDLDGIWKLWTHLNITINIYNSVLWIHHGAICTITDEK